MKVIRLPKGFEMEFVALRLREEEEEMRKKMEKYLTEKEALEKYIAR